MKERNLKKWLFLAFLMTVGSVSLGQYTVKDGEIYYLNDYKVKGINIEKSIILNSQYIKDDSKVFYKDKEITIADPKSFKVLSESVAIDKKHLYSGSLVVTNADSKDYKVYPKGKDIYLILGKKMYFLHADSSIYDMPEVDIDTFEILDYSYSKDKNNLYWDGVKIAHADPDSFRILNENYSIDKNGSYFTYMNLPNADYKSLQSIDSRYAKDSNNVYYWGMNIEGADPSTFKIDDTYKDFGMDKNSVYYMGIKIEKADPKTFKAIDNYFSKDSRNVYYSNEAIKEADPSTFKSIDILFYSIDKNNLYYYSEKIEKIGKDFRINSDHIRNNGKVFYNNYRFTKVNPDKFEVVKGAEGVYVKDDKKVYFIPEQVREEVETEIKGADPSTFSNINNKSPFFAKDRNNVYYGYINEKVIKIEKADLSTFMPLHYRLAKDRNHLYIGKNVIPEINPEGIELVEETFNQYLVKDRKNLYLLEKVGMYSEDNKKYIHKFETISNLDAPTFRKINDLYFSDRNNVYFYDIVESKGLINLEGLSIKDFIIMGEYYSKDNKNVYYGPAKLSNISPDGFEKLTSINFKEILKDRKGVYTIENSFETNKTVNTFKNMDALSFRYIGGNYFKDKNSIYYYNFEGNENFVRVKGADIDTFNVIGDFVFAKDKNNAYCKMEKLSNAHVPTFGMTYFSEDYLYRISDKNYIYDYDTCRALPKK